MTKSTEDIYLDTTYNKFDEPWVYAQADGEIIMNLQEENKKLLDWINDLQSGMYINCVYCGHRYGPTDTTPDTKAEMLKKHIEQCPEHPMSKLKEENNKLKEILKEFVNLDIITKECTAEDEYYGTFIYEKSDQKILDDLQNKAKQLLEKS